jgi:hypothetical protein
LFRVILLAVIKNEAKGKRYLESNQTNNKSDKH